MVILPHPLQIVLEYEPVRDERDLPVGQEPPVDHTARQQLVHDVLGAVDAAIVALVPAEVVHEDGQHSVEKVHLALEFDPGLGLLVIAA